MAWLSKRLGTNLKVPHLESAGFGLVGGRLLPGEEGAVAQFMYQDAKGQRLTLYVRTNMEHNKESAFRFAQEGNVRVFYWIDRRLGYALSGEISKEDCCTSQRQCTSNSIPEGRPVLGSAAGGGYCGKRESGGRRAEAGTRGEREAGGYPAPALLLTTSSSLLFSSLLFS